jgi:hypothetical protein
MMRARASQAASASSETPLSRAELQETLSIHAQEITQNLAQTLGPIVLAQQQLQNQMGYMQHQVLYQDQMPIDPSQQAMQQEDDTNMENPNMGEWQLS